jgi:hypothetical protein
LVLVAQVVQMLVHQLVEIAHLIQSLLMVVVEAETVLLEVEAQQVEVADQVGAAVVMVQVMLYSQVEVETHHQHLHHKETMGVLDSTLQDLILEVVEEVEQVQLVKINQMRLQHQILSQVVTETIMALDLLEHQVLVEVEVEGLEQDQHIQEDSVVLVAVAL